MDNLCMSVLSALSVCAMAWFWLRLVGPERAEEAVWLQDEIDRLQAEIETARRRHRKRSHLEAMLKALRTEQLEAGR